MAGRKPINKCMPGYLLAEHGKAGKMFSRWWMVNGTRWGAGSIPLVASLDSFRRHRDDVPVVGKI